MLLEEKCTGWERLQDIHPKPPKERLRKDWFGFLFPQTVHGSCSVPARVKAHLAVSRQECSMLAGWVSAQG